jgi:pimeloyl-ACP methyl ester carboxylesterase
MTTLLARDKPRAIRRFNRWMNGDIELDDDQVDMVLFVFKNFRQRLPSPKLLPDEALGRITMPTLLVVAEDTIIYDPDVVADRARRLLPDVEVDLIPSAGHGVLLQHPDHVTSRMLEFIGEHDAAE